MAVTFEYRAARSVEEALQLLGQYGDEAKVLAGGQSLMPLINLGLAQPSLLVDVNPIAELDYVEEREGSLAVGALVRHAAAERSPMLRRLCPLLAEVYPLIGDPQVRSRGTMGGSLAHADPVAELPTVAACLAATMRVRGPTGERDLPASDFFVTYLTTAMEPTELLTEVRFPILPAGTGVAFQELVRRKGDFAIVAAAAAVRLAPDGACADVHLALAGVGATPLRADAAAGVLVGQAPTPALVQEAAQAACHDIEPESDVLASADYRRSMAPVYARRALTQAIQRARDAQG